MAQQYTREDIVSRLSSLLLDMVQDWDLDLDEPLGADTRIVADLGFESVDLMQLVVAVEQTFGARGLPYEEVLMEDGGYVNELTIGQLADFLTQALGESQSTGTA